MPVSVTSISPILKGMTGSTNFQYPADLPKYYMSMIVNDYNKTSIQAPSELNPIGNICLPLPSGLLDAHLVEYDEQSMGLLLGGLVNSVANQYGDRPWNDQGALGRIGNMASQAGKSIAGNFPTTAGAAGEAGVAAAAGLGIPAAQAWAGLSPNAFMVVLLKGPTFKKFSFQWSFSPKNPAEAETLRQIIKNLNNWMSPALTWGGALWSFPKIFNLAFVPNPKYLYKFKPAVLEQLQVSYAPGKQPAFYRAAPETGGLNAPEGMEISMSFHELEYWLQGDFDHDSNDPFDVRGPRPTPFQSSGGTPIDPNSP